MALVAYVQIVGAQRIICLERKVWEGLTLVYEDGGTLQWDGDQFSWILPHEAYRACTITPTELEHISKLLQWLNS